MESMSINVGCIHLGGHKTSSTYPICGTSIHYIVEMEKQIVGINKKVNSIKITNNPTQPEPQNLTKISPIIHTLIFFLFIIIILLVITSPTIELHSN